MSQYALIPILKANELQETYSIATPETWKITKGTTEYGGLEENVFNDIQKAEIEALGGQWFNDATEFKNWLNA